MPAYQVEWILFTNAGEDVLTKHLMSNLPPAFLLHPFKGEMRPLMGYHLSIQDAVEKQLENLFSAVENLKHRLKREGFMAYVQGIKLLAPCLEFQPHLLRDCGYRDIPPFKDMLFIKYEKHFNVGISRLGHKIQIQIRPKASGSSIINPAFPIVKELIKMLNGLGEQLTMI